MNRSEVERILTSAGWVLSKSAARKEASYKDAVRAFQAGWTWEHLAIDGVVGPRTSAALVAFNANGYRLSTHFRAVEFRCGCKGQFVGCATQMATRQLLAGLEVIRAGHYPGGLRIVSGYRCQKYNDSLKYSIKSSMHLRGQAADIPGAVKAASMTAPGITGYGIKKSTGRVIHVEHGRYNVKTVFVDQP